MSPVRSFLLVRPAFSTSPGWKKQGSFSFFFSLQNFQNSERKRKKQLMRSAWKNKCLCCLMRCVCFKFFVKKTTATRVASVFFFTCLVWFWLSLTNSRPKLLGSQVSLPPPERLLASCWSFPTMNSFVVSYVEGTLKKKMKRFNFPNHKKKKKTFRHSVVIICISRPSLCGEVMMHHMREINETLSTINTTCSRIVHPFWCISDNYFFNILILK